MADSVLESTEIDSNSTPAQITPSPDDNLQEGKDDSKNNFSLPDGTEEKTTVVVNIGDESSEKFKPRRGWWQRS